MRDIERDTLIARGIPQAICALENAQRLRVVSKLDGSTLAMIRCEWRSDDGSTSYHVTREPAPDGLPGGSR